MEPGCLGDADCEAWLVPVAAVSQTVVCFTVEPAGSKGSFQARQYVNQLVNESMCQNGAEVTSSETITVH